MRAESIFTEVLNKRKTNNLDKTCLKQLTKYPEPGYLKIQRESKLPNFIYLHCYMVLDNFPLLSYGQLTIVYFL